MVLAANGEGEGRKTPATTEWIFCYRLPTNDHINKAGPGGIDRARFLCLWNSGGSDGPGGTEHLYKEVGLRTGRVTHIDTREL